MRHLAKPFLNVCCGIMVLPAVLAYRLQTMIFRAERVFPGWAQLFSILPGLTGVYLRHAFFRRSMKQCGMDACISFGTIFSHPNTSIGRTAYIGHYCSIGEVTIEDDVLIASHVSIMNGCHQHGIERLDIPLREQSGQFEPVTIGRDTWIGERATIAASVGRHCIIGAGSLVLSPVPDYSIAVGVPARVIRDRRQPAKADSLEETMDRMDSAVASLF